MNYKIIEIFDNLVEIQGKTRKEIFDHFGLKEPSDTEIFTYNMDKAVAYEESDGHATFDLLDKADPKIILHSVLESVETLGLAKVIRQMAIMKNTIRKMGYE